MKKIFVAIIIAFSLAGCMTPKFAVKKADNRFNEDKNPVYIAENNRISKKSIAGGIHIDEKGVYINPFVSKSRETEKIVLLGLNVVNKTDYDTTHGGVNQLGVIKEVVFRLSDDDLITLNVTDQENRSSDTVSYNSVARYASYDKWETGAVRITKEQLQKIASAKTVSCKITGSKQSVVYEKEDVDPEFLPNLKKFYKEYVE